PPARAGRRPHPPTGELAAAPPDLGARARAAALAAEGIFQMNEFFNDVQVWRTRVTMGRETYDLMLYRLGLPKKPAEQLRDRVRELDALLRTALHDMAVERGEEPFLFSRRWVRAHRRDEIPIPLYDRGGEAPSERS